MKLRLHVVSLPHTQTTHEFDHCAYTAKVRKFCDMMTAQGHEVLLYSGEENEAACTEHITVMTNAKQKEFFGEQKKEEFFKVNWAVDDPAWQHMNEMAIKEMASRLQPKDFICIIGGICQKRIADAFPNHMSVEYGIGYTGTFSKYRVFESYAHMHYVHGFYKDDNGSFYDTVIPNYYEPTEFPFAAERGNYYLFIGRLIDRKGYRIAQEVCERLGKKLIVAGQGDFAGYGKYVGVVDAKRRGALMSKATAVFVPTTYLEPFGGVHAEALLCGTPVITTNFGVFTETVHNGYNGYRCNIFQDFLYATDTVTKFSEEQRIAIREEAQNNFGMPAVALRYEDYFQRLLDLWADGWYQLDAVR